MTMYISSAVTSKGDITKRSVHYGNNNKFTLINETVIFTVTGTREYIIMKNQENFLNMKWFINKNN